MTTSTLASLNSNSQTTLSFTDNRPSNVLFNFLTARDIDETITAQSFTLKRRIDITEIIKPSESLPQFIVNVSGVTGATATFGTLPTGVSVSNNGAGVYTVNGMTTVSDWEAVRAPTITVPATYFGATTVDCTIRWYNSLEGAYKTQTWTHGNYIPVTLMNSVSSISCDGEYIAGADAQLDGVFIVRAITPVENILPAIFSIEADNIKITSPGTVTLDSAFGIDLDFTVRNLKDLTYLSNQENLIFASPKTPVIQTTPTSTSVTLTVNSGVIGLNATDILTNSVTITGTPAYVNSIIDTVKYYPSYTQTSVENLTWSQTDDGTPLDDIEVLITNNGAGSISTVFETFTSNANYETPYWAFAYGQLDVLLVGGGGGGTDQGGGGGGGGVNEQTNVSWGVSQQTFAINIGTGGSRGAEWNTNNTRKDASDGNDTTAFGYTAGGGKGGDMFVNYQSSVPSTVFDKDGGASGSPLNVAGGSYNGSVPYQQSSLIGGAGGSGSGSGTTTGYGGSGYTSTIFGGVYGGGGQGNEIKRTDNNEDAGGSGGGGGYNVSGTDFLGGGGGAGDYDLPPLNEGEPGNGGTGVVKIKISPK